MWGPATALALSEQFRIAEEHTLKIRAELFRLRCSGEISVEQDKTCLRLTCGNETVIKQPIRLLTMLKEIQHVESSDDLWVLLQKEAMQAHKSYRLVIWLMGFLMLFALTAAAITSNFRSLKG